MPFLTANKPVKHVLYSLLFLLVVLLFSFSASANKCSTIYEAKKKDIQGEALLDRIQQALKSIDITGVEVSKTELQALTKNKNGLNTLKTLMVHRRTLREIVWFVLEDRIFNSQILENQHFAVKTENVHKHFKTKLPNSYDTINLFKKVKSNRNSYQTKVTLIKLVKIYNLFLSYAFNREINLLNESDVFWLLKVKSRSEVPARRIELSLENDALFLRLQPFLSNPLHKSYISVHEKLVAYFFGNDTLQVSILPHDLGFFERGPSLEESTLLINLMKLPKETEDDLIDDLNVVSTKTSISFSNREAAILKQHVYAMIVLKAAEHILGKIQLPYGGEYQETYLSPKTYLNTKNKILSIEFIRAITEEMMADYINQSDVINGRIDEVIQASHRISNRSQTHTKRLNAIETQAVALKVREFDIELDTVDNQLFKLEVLLDEIREEIATKKRRENITDFFELNNRWQRLIANKSYSLKGIDYNSVRFSEGVIEYFYKNPKLGARYLAALSKSYVGIKKESGLRRLQSIHSQMRDIKIIRAHGKLRIVGKLIDGEIHFFHIYNSEKPYKDSSMNQLINSYTP